VRGRGAAVAGFAGRGGGARGGRRPPATTGDLDKELDGFMTTNTVSRFAGSQTGQKLTVGQAGNGDVEMA
jgi:hypothetical protein